MTDKLNTFILSIDWSSHTGLLLLVMIFFVISFILGIIFQSLYRKAHRQMLSPKEWREAQRRRFKRKFFKKRFKPHHAALACVVLFLLSTQLLPKINSYADTEEDADSIVCSSPYIIDGDTFSCGNTRIRLYAIDAPEMPDHCRKGRRCTPGNPFKSKEYLEDLTRSRVVCRALEIDSYGRTIARCFSKGKDLSCAMVEAGHAVERYGRLNC